MLQRHICLLRTHLPISHERDTYKRGPAHYEQAFSGKKKTNILLLELSLSWCNCISMNEALAATFLQQNLDCNY